MIVIGDRLLLTLLANGAEEPGPRLRTALAAAEVFTTGSWYWRLARDESAGSMGYLSRRLAVRPIDAQRSVEASLSQLPGEIGMLPFESWSRSCDRSAVN